MSLFVVCLVAFFTVMILLSGLALVIRLLTTLFPEVDQPAPGATPDTIDAATVAAIDAAVSRQIPGARLLRVERDPPD